MSNMFAKAKRFHIIQYFPNNTAKTNGLMEKEFK